MFSLKNPVIKKSILVYLFLISLLFIYEKSLFLDNSLSKLAWLVIIISIISYVITTNYLI
jgi:hypothetical protein